ncbi:MAG: hypothetical protein ABFD89_21530 [Bryobacteraceae bacterium]
MEPPTVKVTATVEVIRERIQQIRDRKELTGEQQDQGRMVAVRRAEFILHVRFEIIVDNIDNNTGIRYTYTESRNPHNPKSEKRSSPGERDE